MRALFLSLCTLTLMAQPVAPTPDPHAADRQQLLKIFHEVESSINSQSLERMAQQMDPNGIVVWANGEVSRGPAEVRAYYDRMVKGKDRILTKYLTAGHLHGPARFLGNGDIAVADGTMDDQYFPVIRGPFRLTSKWTTTVAKTNGEWKIISLHLSSNVFNNVLLDEAKAALLYTTIGGLLGGAVAGWALTRYLAKRRAGA